MSIAILAALALLAFSQSTEVPVTTVVTPLEDGGAEIELVNHSDHPITAFAVVAEGRGSSSKRPPITVYYYDSVRHHWKDRPIFTNERWKMGFGALPAPQTIVALMAVIFESGATYGDDVWIAKLIELRHMTLKRAEEALARLRDTQNAGGSKEQLIEEFASMLESAEKSAVSREERMVAREVFGTVLENLRRSATGESSLSQIAAVAMEMLELLHNRLAAAKPGVGAG
jgi:hypothetical protein